jgi:hypothetical protein
MVKLQNIRMRFQPREHVNLAHDFRSAAFFHGFDRYVLDRMPFPPLIDYGKLPRPDLFVEMVVVHEGRG